MATNAITSEARNKNKPMSRLPWLVRPVLKFNLSREIDELRSKESWSRETGRSSKTLAKHRDLRVVVVLMKGGTQMNQHRSAGQISIHQLLGTCCVRLPDREVILGVGDLIVLDGGEPHDVEALEECAFLLTIAWRDDEWDSRNPSGVSTDSNLDEEALSRMDGEGGPCRPWRWS